MQMMSYPRHQDHQDAVGQTRVEVCLGTWVPRGLLRGRMINRC